VLDSFSPFARPASCGTVVTWRPAAADDIGLALAERFREGDRSVAHGDLATALGDVEWPWVRRVVADERVALPVHEQIGALRDEIAVPTPQPCVLVAPRLQEASLGRPGRVAHEREASRMRDLPGAREVDDPDESARDRVVDRRPGTDPFAMVVAE